MSDVAFKLIPFLFFGLFFASCGKNGHGVEHRGQASVVDTMIIKKWYDQADSLKSSNPDSAIILLTHGLKQIPTGTSDTTLACWKARIHLSLGNLTLSKGALTESLAHDSTALLIGQTCSNKRIVAQAINNMGLLAYSQGNFETALQHYETAMNIAKANDYQDVMAKVYTNKAIINFLQGDQKLAQTLFLQTLSIGKQLKDTVLMTGTLINLGMCYAGSDYSLSTAYYLNAIHVYQQQGNLADQVICYQNIGANYLSLDDYSKAIDAFLKSLDFAKKTGDKANIAKDYHNLGELYATIGDFSNAVDYYIRAVTIKESINDNVSSADTYNGLGGVYFRNDQFAKAEAAYKKALH
ncbi:MAG: tetratricopeptide repeat protein, partial [Bacteroidota bacterium]|nr:tetratricopeptide repeat protein [Bacteroidota bacterium]